MDFSEKKRRGCIMDEGDVISRLPDHLLISILSRLTLKEAMVTNLLSRRWEKLWTFYRGNLDFEVSEALRQKGCSHYARLVNKVLDTLELVEGGCVLDSFTIRFNLCPDNLSSLDRWVQFALEKRGVKRLDFDPRLFFRGCEHYVGSYNFPPLRCFYAQNRNIQALISIRFERVNVSGEIIEHFLSNCPLLRRLDLINLCKPLLTHLRVSGETLALSHLVVRTCPYLTTIEISAPNLVSFQYLSIGTTAKFAVRNVPKLVEFSIGALKSPLIASALHLLRCFSHIQKLELCISSEEPEDLIKLIELNSLKHLTMSVTGRNCGHILAWTPLLKSFPALQKFTLDMCYRREDRINRVPRDHDKFPSRCLKEFEFLGFGKWDDDIDLVMYFLKNMTVPLEKIILRCDGGALPLSAPDYNTVVEEALIVAAKLKQIIPKEVNLVFLSPRVCSF